MAKGKRIKPSGKKSPRHRPPNPYQPPLPNPLRHPHPGEVPAKSDGPFFRRVDWIAALVATLVSLGYLYTLAPDVTLEDSGELAVIHVRWRASSTRVSDVDDLFLCSPKSFLKHRLARSRQLRGGCGASCAYLVDDFRGRN